MKIGRLLLVTSLLACQFIQACSQGEPSSALPVPSMVPFMDDPFAESGIRATPDAVIADTTAAGGVLVEWKPVDANSAGGATVGGYYLYRSETRTESEPKRFSRLNRIKRSPAGDDTSFIDEGIQLGYIYSYYVTAYNGADDSQESGPSDTVQFMPTTRPILKAPIGPIPMPRDGKVVFQFEPRAQIGGYVAIEVNEVAHNSEEVVIDRVWRGEKVLVEPGSGRLDYDGAVQLQEGHRYRWRIIKTFTGAPIPMGNTSQWKTFTIE